MKRAWLPLALLAAGCALPPAGGGAGVGAEGRPLGEEDSRARIHAELGAGYHARGQYAVALEELNKAQALDAAYPPTYNVLGLVHAELREDRQAEAYFRRALELSPQYSEANNNYGMFLCQRRRIDAGLALLERALANPLYATPERALANAGACVLEKGDVAAAEPYFVRAIKRAPHLPLAQLGMAEVHFRQGRWLAARNLLRQLTLQAEAGPQALWLALRVERVAGDREAEANYGARLRRRYPDAMQTQWLITGQYDQPGSLL